MKKLSIITFCLLISAFCQAQINAGTDLSNIQFERPVEYEIGGITVEGIENLDKNAIIILSGLTVGDKILVPGEKISSAVKKLWEQDLFSHISIKATKIIGNTIFLEIHLSQLPRLTKFGFKGASKSEVDKLRDKVKLVRGKIVTENLINNTKHIISEYFVEKGYRNTDINIIQKADTTKDNSLILDIEILKGEKTKIESINFYGLTKFNEGKLKRAMKDTKVKKPYRIFKSSKFLDQAYKDDLNNIIDLYNQGGLRDARIVKDSIYSTSENTIAIDLYLEEGSQYYFRDISWLGNTKFSSETLDEMLGINSGDPYDQKLMSDRLQMSMSGTDVSSLYMDDGYLFFNIDPVEILIENDSIDYEIRLYEGKQATIKKVTIVGNTKTNDHVIMREIRTKPGSLFSRSDIIRSQEELNRLNYFNPQTMGVTPKPDPETGDVDIEYSVEEKPSDQIELQGGWGAGRMVGTFGVTFNNFSFRNILNPETWSPLPSGDGQRIQLRASSNGTYYQNYSFSFTEPWLGGKSPNSLTVSAYRSIQNYNTSKINITGINVGLGKRLKWPDDYFTFSQSINFKQYKLENRMLVPGFDNGTSKNITYKANFSRNSVFNPIYPKAGSTFSFSGDFTPPYSLFNDKDYKEMSLEDKYKWLEYYKIKASGTWYSNLFGDFVMKTHSEFGFLGSYNGDIGLPPFERFYVGGDGLTGFVLDGRETISLRGYPNQSLSSHLSAGGGVYSKYNLEFRYPLTLNPNSTIYVTAFAEAGNAWADFSKFKPFEVKRSAGFGIRVFMPMFGILGVDFGHGFDPIPGSTIKSGWQTHFTIGQQF
jgi:outer membrane protein insertion porin family